MIYAVLHLQNRHSKWVTGKIVFLKGLWLLTAKARWRPGAFFDSLLIIADWVKLLGNVYVVCFNGVMWFGGLTRVFAGVGRRDR
jgi:hypothetical protein